MRASLPNQIGANLFAILTVVDLDRVEVEIRFFRREPELAEGPADGFRIP